MRFRSVNIHQMSQGTTERARRNHHCQEKSECWSQYWCEVKLRCRRACSNAPNEDNRKSPCSLSVCYGAARSWIHTCLWMCEALSSTEYSVWNIVHGLIYTIYSARIASQLHIWTWCPTLLGEKGIQWKSGAVLATVRYDARLWCSIASHSMYSGKVSLCKWVQVRRPAMFATESMPTRRWVGLWKRCTSDFMWESVQS